MVPQNVPGRPQPGPQQNSFMAGNMGFDGGFPGFNMDSAQAKQFAALSAASQARMAVNSRPNPVHNPASGTNSAPFLGGINSNSFSTNTPDSSSATASGQMLNNGMPHPNAQSAPFMNPGGPQQAQMAQQQAAAAMKHRQQGFLASLANVMSQRGTPLPPQLTGIQVPNWDPTNTIFKNVELSPEVGHFRLGGKDINLMKLFMTVYQGGGGHSVSAKNAWGQIIAQFGLPEEIPGDPPGAGTTSTIPTIKQYYQTMLYPFEQNYKSNVQEQQKRAQLAASQQAGMAGSQPSTPARPGFPGNMPPGQPQRQPVGGMGSSGNLPIATPQSPMNGIAQAQPSLPHQPGTPINNAHFPPGINGPNFGGQPHPESGLNEQELQGLKRKMEDDEKDGKRSRQKTGSEPPETTSLVNGADAAHIPSTSSPAVAAPTRQRSQPSRRKIEYVPLARDVDTYGGRDAKFIEHEMNNIANRRPIRDLSDWGTIDIEALTLSIRSRLSVELAYALTTLSLLSTMRGQEPGAGFPIFNCPDLFDETLDLLEELAFGGPEDEADIYEFDSQIITNRELVSSIHETEDLPFAGLKPRQGSKDPEVGPKQRPGNFVLAIFNIIRNLSIFNNNLDFLWRHPRLVDIMLRICSVKRDSDGKPTPISPVLSLSDIVDLRQDALYVFISLANNIHLAGFPENQAKRMAGRIFNIVSSFLIDPTEAVTPLASVQLAGAPTAGNVRPASLTDLALEALDRFGHLDANRQVFSKTIPKESLHCLFKALVHRLPVSDADFQLMLRDVWLVHLERIVMAIYSLAFLSPPDLKRKIKTDRKLGFKTIMFRMVQKFLMMPTVEARSWFLICARRAVEAMKVLDDGEDSFDMSGKSTGPAMAFGMGFGEAGDTGAEPGTGLLASHRDVAWDILMTREVGGDEVLFKELESLARVEC